MKYFLAIIFSFGIFLVGDSAFASSAIYEQEIQTASTTLTNSAPKYVGQFFYNTKMSEIKTVDLMLCRNRDFQSSESLWIRVSKNSNQNVPAWSDTLNLVFSEPLSTSNASWRNPNNLIPLCNGGTPNLMTSFINKESDGVKLEKNQWYFLRIYQPTPASGANLNYFYSDGASVFGAAEETVWTGSLSDTEYPNRDLTFRLYGLFQSDYISFKDPNQGGVYLPFNNWTVLFSGSSTNPNPYYIKLEYGNTSAMLNTPIIEPIVNESDSMWTFAVPETLNDGLFYSRLSLIAGSSTVATTLQISFAVNSIIGSDINTSATGFIPSDITATSTGAMSAALTSSMNFFSKFFPFNIGVNFYNAWVDSANTVLPGELSFLDVADAQGNVYYDMKDVLHLQTSVNMLLWGPALWYDNSTAQTFFERIRLLSKYFMWAFFIFSLRKRAYYYYDVITNKD